jgi:IrrE N-terminal-like domain
LLKRASVIDTLPTPLDEVRRAAGIRQRIDISQLPKDIAAVKPSGMRQIIGAYLFRERVVFIDGKMAAPRQRFTDGHEITHSILPSHARSHCLDDERIFKEVEDYLDLEANVGATYLLFQGPRFHRRALEYETSINTPRSMAGEYGASYHSTIRFYVENHPEPLALVVTGHIPRSGGRLPVWNWCESPSFTQRFGQLQDFVPDPSLNPLRDGVIPFAKLTTATRVAVDTVAEEVNLVDRNGELHPFLAEAWFNQHVHFLMLSPKHRLRRGRHIQVITE